MAICNLCKQEMTDPAVTSCTKNTSIEFPGGKKKRAIQYGGEKRCHDCNVLSGGFHHPGCDMERCPKCHGQLIGCGCLEEST